MDAQGMGFLEEAPGVKSMTRLTVAVMLVGVLAIIAAIVVVAVKDGGASTATIAALATPLLPLAAGIWAALKVRE